MASLPAMALVRLGRPTFLADTGLSLLFGAVGGLVVAVVVALSGFPEWGETLQSFLVVFSFALPLGLALRLVMHWTYESINRGLPKSADEGVLSRQSMISYSRPPMRFGAGSVGAAAVLTLAYLLGTGDVPD